MSSRHPVVVLPFAGHHVELELIDRRSRSYEIDVDGIPQSVVSLREPRMLEWPYVRHIARAIDGCAPPGEPLRLVHLGAGGLTLPRYAAVTRPGSPQLVVELSEEFAQAVVTALPLPEGTSLRFAFGDARAVAEQAPDAVGWHPADVTVVDLWEAAVISARVASLEFYSLVAARSAPSGLVAVNLLDGADHRYARAQAATLGAVFEHVAVVLEAMPDPTTPPGNVVVFASASPLGFMDSGDWLSSERSIGRDPHVLRGAELEAWIAGAAAVTDATAIDSPALDDPRFADAVFRDDD